MRTLPIAGVLLCTAALTACGGGGNSGAAPPLPAGGGRGTQQILVGAAGATVALPALPGVTASAGFAPGDAPDGTLLDIDASLTGASGAMPASTARTPEQRGSVNVVFFVTFTVPHDVTLAHAPSFVYTLANGTSPYQQYYYAVSDPAVRSALAGYRTEGPGTVNGSTVTIGPSQTPLTLHAGLPYIFAFYGVDSGQQRVLGTWHEHLAYGMRSTAPTLFSLKTQIFPAGTNEQAMKPCITDDVCGNVITPRFSPLRGDVWPNLVLQTVTLDAGFSGFAQTAALLRDDAGVIVSCLDDLYVHPPECESITGTSVGSAFFPNGGSFATDAIDRIDTRYDSYSSLSPGSDPNHDGVWTDVSGDVTVLVYGHPL